MILKQHIIGLSPSLSYLPSGGTFTQREYLSYATQYSNGFGKQQGKRFHFQADSVKYRYSSSQCHYWIMGNECHGSRARRRDTSLVWWSSLRHGHCSK